MNNNWVIAPFTFEQPKNWQRAWEANLERGFISIGWRLLGKTEGKSKSQIKAKYRKTYPEESASAASSVAGILRRFHQIEIGDTIVARRGRKSIASVGVATSRAYFDKSMAAGSFPKGRHFPFANHIDVDWNSEACDLEFEKTVFGMLTVHGISDAKLQRLLKIHEGREFHFADELKIENHFEGEASTVLVNSYERNRKARAECLSAHGYSCFVCDMSFAERYGKIGINFIHVHHLVPISKRKKRYKLNPKKDLAPVCPNCHAMLHTSDPPLTIRRLKSIISNNGG